MTDMMSLFYKVWQKFYYGALGYAPDIDLSVIPSSITIHPHYDAVNKVYWVESPELPDFEATGKTLEALAEHVGDSLLVYFDIPYYFARQYVDGALTIKDPKTGKEEVVRISRKNLEKALA